MPLQFSAIVRWNRCPHDLGREPLFPLVFPSPSLFPYFDDSSTLAAPILSTECRIACNGEEGNRETGRRQQQQGAPIRTHEGDRARPRGDDEGKGEDEEGRRRRGVHARERERGGGKREIRRGGQRGSTVAITATRHVRTAVAAGVYTCGFPMR
jgi:hypothetical protein